MSAKPSICFVTNELYPLGPGGIGRMLYNFARHNESLGFPAEINFLVPRSLIESRADALEELEAALDGLARVHVCPALSSVPTPMAQLLAKAEDYPWTGEWIYGESYRYFLGLRMAETTRGAPFDVIEFPDFGGWGIATIEAKRAGLAFTETVISARVHSTQGILYGVERFAHDPGHWAGIMFDAERHLFANADLIVGHDPAIIDYTASSYALEARWEGRTVLEFPPIFVRTAPSTYVRADEVRVPPPDQSIDFLFGSRLQPVKRPDIFIRAAILYLESYPEYSGTFRLVCGGWDREFIDSLKSLVPDAYTERVLFIERATSDERQYYINRSIVVIPSDYESLCLFAFEAVLAGRKLILNGACPAFGNGFRWRDRENCLLFNGSVDSLTAIMREALSWRPTADLPVTPSSPYWLNRREVEALPRPVERAAPIRVYAYGAQSPTEFNRHFEAAIQLEEGLRAAKRSCDVVVQLPSGSFAKDSPESRAVRERGWAVVFSSGNRECPEMFGHRIAGLGGGAVLLFPFGFEPSPSFVASAADVFESNPSLAIVGGHLELVDGATGRSDYIRVYSGEAPTTALLSSRIAPPLCFVNTDAVRRIGFDALAGGLWFEVFARRCALGGEPIAILPALAATLDALLQRKLETTKRVSAGLLDQLGRAAGWQARLLSVDPVQVPAESDGRPLSYGSQQLRNIFRISPASHGRSWEPIGWQDSAGGVLVHPLNGEITIGELPGPYRRVSRIVTHVQNVRNDNDGAMVAVALARSNVTINEILQVAQGRGGSRDVALSAWSMLAPGAAVDIACPCYGVSKGADKILLLTRVPEGKSEEYAQVIFTGLDLHFSDHTIG